MCAPDLIFISLELLVHSEFRILRVSLERRIPLKLVLYGCARSVKVLKTGSNFPYHFALPSGRRYRGGEAAEAEVHHEPEQQPA